MFVRKLRQKYIDENKVFSMMGPQGEDTNTLLLNCLGGSKIRKRSTAGDYATQSLRSSQVMHNNAAGTNG